jgi:exosome complex component RRP45
VGVRKLIKMASFAIFKDDSGPKSVSNSERRFIRNCANTIIRQQNEEEGTDVGATSVLRTDGRHPGEVRPIQLTFGRTHSMIGSGSAPRAECTVQLGMTRVSCIVTCDLVPPMNAETRPNDGQIVFSVDLSPMASMGYSAGGGGGGGDSQQKRMSNRLERTLEKVLVEGGAMDVESLCVVGGEWVWRLNVDVTALDDAGNLVDATILSAMATLRHFRKPHVRLLNNTSNDGNDGGPSSTSAPSKPTPVILSSDEREPTPLPLHHTPLCVSFGLFGNSTTGVDIMASSTTNTSSTAVAALADPSEREEMVMDGTVTYAFNRHGELCMTDFLGGCELTPMQLIQCAKLALQKAVELCTMLEQALEGADQKAAVERLLRLKRQHGDFAPITMLNQHSGQGLLGSDTRKTNMTSIEGFAPMVIEDGADSATKNSKDAENDAHEEMVRKQALDYSIGHVAAKVKEKDNRKTTGSTHSKASESESTSWLIESMIRSATAAADASSSSNTTTRTMASSADVTDAQSSSRNAAANDEFEQFAAANTTTTKTKAKTPPSKKKQQTKRQKRASEKSSGNSNNANDEDDEEDVVMLKSEF